MINVDEEALICDLAETYQIYDYRQLPPSKVAVFACGLKLDSRIQMKLNNWNIDLNTQLIAGIFDITNMLLWSKTKDAEKGKNRPTSLRKALISNDVEKKRNEVTFESGKEFESARRKIMMKGGKNNGN